MSASDMYMCMKFPPFSSIPFLDFFSVFVSSTYKCTKVTEKYQLPVDIGQYTCMLFISKSEVSECPMDLTPKYVTPVRSQVYG